MVVLLERVGEKDSRAINKMTKNLKPWRCPIPQPILCLDKEVDHTIEKANLGQIGFYLTTLHFV